MITWPSLRSFHVQVPWKSWWQSYKQTNQNKKLTQITELPNFSGPFTVYLLCNSSPHIPHCWRTVVYLLISPMAAGCDLQVGCSLHSDWLGLRWWDLRCLNVRIVAVCRFRISSHKSFVSRGLFCFCMCLFGDLTQLFREFPLVFVLRGFFFPLFYFSFFFLQCRNGLKMWKMLNAFRETQSLDLGLSKHGSLFFSFPTLNI